MKSSGPVIFLILLGLCTAFIWPLYEDAIEEDLSTKVKKLYVNQIHNTPQIHFDGLHLQMISGEITPYFHQKLERIAGAYIPPASSLAKKTTPEPEIIPEVTVTETKPEPTPTKPITKAQLTSFNLTHLSSTVKIGGLLPDAATRDAIVQIISDKVPHASLIDQSELADNPAPAWWHQHPTKFLPDFLTAIHGYAYLDYSAERIKVIAKVGDPGELARLNQEIAELPSSITQDTKLAFLAPPKKKPANSLANATPQQPGRALIVEIDESQPTEFDEIHIAFGGGGSAWLHPKYNKTFKQLVSLINDHPNSEQPFTITSYGTKPLKLSKLRAKAVQDKLIKMGIPEERLLTAHLPRQRGEKRRVQLRLSTEEEILLSAEDTNAVAEQAAKEEAARQAELALPPVPVALLNEIFTFGGGGSAWLHPKTTPKIKKLAQFILEFPDASQKFTVASYGTKKTALSRLRAAAIRDKLISFDVPADRLLIGDFGRRKKQKRRVQLNLATPEDITNFTPAPVEEKPPAEPAEEPSKPAPPELTTATVTEETVPVETPEIESEEKPIIPDPAGKLSQLPINFSGDFSSWIHSSYFPQLRKMADIIESIPEKQQRIIIGSYGCKDPAISQKRAEATREKLIANGISPDRLQIEHFEAKSGEDSRVELTLGAIPEIPKAEVVAPDETLPAVEPQEPLKALEIEPATEPLSSTPEKP